MIITFQHLSGTFENTDKVIAYNIEENWTVGNTDNMEPVFENGTDEPDYTAQFERSGPNTILVNTLENNMDETSDEVNSDTVHSVQEEIVITIIAESRNARILFEKEVNRILWELSPNSSTRLIKSDTADSHIDHFTKSEVSFRQIEIPDNDTMHLQGSEGILTCVYYKFKS